MSMSTDRERKTYGAILGWQEQIRGSNLTVSGTPVIGDISGMSFGKLAGQVLATGTFYYFLPVSGVSAVDVTLIMSAHTGSAPTVTLYKLLSDKLTEKLDSTGGTTARVTITLTDGTQITGSMTGMRGEQGLMLKVVVPSSATATFTVAEFSAL